MEARNKWRCFPVKKSVALLLAVALLFVFVAGCGNGGAVEPKLTTEPAQEQSVHDIAPQPQAFDRVTAISIGISPAIRDSHVVVVRDDGTAWAWGRNGFRQLGYTPTTTDSRIPVQSQEFDDIIAVAAGGLHTVALRDDGSVWAWGSNFHGQLGDGTNESSVLRRDPVQVEGLSDIIAVAAGESHSVALRSDGTVWAWGSNREGQLGDGSTTEQHSPVQVRGLSNITSIAAGANHTVALRNDGIIWAWGRNLDHQLGDTTTILERTTPVQVQGIDDVIYITASDTHTLALRGDGSVWWSTREGFVQQQNRNDITAIAQGRAHTVTLREDGTVWSWGRNNYGQLGDGTTRDGDVSVQALDDVVAIAAAGDSTIALRSDGTVWAWGSNERGQLGDGTTVMFRSNPVQVGVQGAREVPTTAQQRQCEFCEKEGVRSFRGASGTTEWFCMQHYEEILALFGAALGY